MRADTLDKMQRACAWVEGCLGRTVLALEALVPGMGARRYWRARLADGATAVLMHAAPEDPAILPPQLRRPSDELPFVVVTRLLARHRLPVPELYAVEPAERWVLLEDLGDVHLADLAPAERGPHYEAAIDTLARAHAIPPGAGLPFDRGFDAEWIGFELRHFREHGVPAARAGALGGLLDALAQRIAALPRALCLRDYQSSNLMIDRSGRLRILDYQDALLAPPELDLAALLWDSYVEIGRERRESLLARWAARSGRALARDRLALLLVQRKLKDFARYRFMATAKGDARFLRYVEPARAAVLEGLAALPPDLAALARELAPIVRTEAA